MTFISYAQNFEDVMLWRALKHVPAGKYIDVGAQDPIIDSVSKAFYEHGWRGIHVEPVPHYADMLRRDRPDETVLQMALSDQPGILELNVFDDTGLSTGIQEFAENHRTQHGLVHRTVATPMLPIRSAFASLAGQPIHWLKIDVEGLEEAVLRGWDSEVLRPWIIVIEATVPMSTEVRYQGAEDILLAARYEFAYFDGLNRFYVAAEHPELKPAFSSPPNVFDGVRLSGLASSELCRGLLEAHRAETNKLDETIRLLRSEALQAQVEAQRRQREVEAQARRRQREVEAQAQRDAQAASAALQVAESQCSAVQYRLDAVLNSTSWRITAPMRSVGTLCRRLFSAAREGRVRSGIKRRIKAALRLCALAVAKHPTLRRGALAFLKLLPPLHRRLRAALAPPPTIASAFTDDLPPTRPLNINDLTPAAVKIYAVLSEAQSKRSS
jgi:FkbM family methyltransferase